MTKITIEIELDGTFDDRHEELRMALNPIAEDWVLIREEWG